MVRHADTEMIAMKEEVYTHGFLEIENVDRHIGPHGEAPRLVMRQRSGKNMGESFTVVSAGKTRQGGVKRLRIS